MGSTLGFSPDTTFTPETDNLYDYCEASFEAGVSPQTGIILDAGLSVEGAVTMIHDWVPMTEDCAVAYGDFQEYWNARKTQVCTQERSDAVPPDCAYVESVMVNGSPRFDYLAAVTHPAYVAEQAVAAFDAGIEWLADTLPGGPASTEPKPVQGHTYANVDQANVLVK
jgi:hypothetical protein